MGAFSFRRCGEDLLQQFRTHKTKLLLTCVFTLAGVILGVTLFCISQYNWWYCNRYDYATKLLYGGFFAVLLSFLLAATVMTVLCCLFSAWRQTKFLCYLLAFVAALYFGANLAAIFACVGFLGVLYGVFLLVLELAVNALCCFWVVTDRGCNYTFKQTVLNCRPIIIVQFSAALIKLLLFFLLLRPISALI